MQDISKSEKPTIKKWKRAFVIFLVVAIIICIANMFSMCASQDYTKRTYIAEGMAIATAAKLASSKFYEKEKRFPTDNNEASLPEPNQIIGQAVKAVAIMPKGIIAITYNEKVKDNAELWMQAEFKEGDIIWQCIKGNDPEEAIKLDYLPANCRSAIMDKS